jgi:hypothetical protein
MNLRRLVPVTLLAAGLGAASALHAETKPPPVATCVKSWGEVRARAYGYDHFVHLESSCKKTALCAVSTDVNPEVQTVSLAAGASTEVATFLGSPASTFTPKVACTLP